MGNDFHNDFFGKIFVKIFVVCEGLKTEKKRYETNDCLLVFCYFYANTAPLKQHRMLLMDLKSTSYFKVHNFNFCR